MSKHARVPVLLVLIAIAAIVVGATVPNRQAVAQEDQGGRDLPPAGADIGPSPTLGMAPPANAVVLFDGTDMSHWHGFDGKPVPWVVADGAATVRGGYAIANETHGDAYLHVEFKEPYMPEAHGQGRGNSGVFAQGRYEIQVLDSYGKEELGKGDCAALYGQFAALVNACRPPDEWQTFDIIFRQARLDAEGKIAEQTRITLLHNGIVVHNNVATPIIGGAIDPNEGTPGPLMLQDHGCPLQYRNIWFVPLPEKGADKYE